MRHAEACCLCSQIAGAPGNDLIATLLPGEPYRRRVMLESPSFAAIPSLGPLTRGHSLLCPKSHCSSFARLEPALHAEFAAIKAKLVAALRALYGADIHSFEHGMADDSGHMLCSVEHAHLHFVPLPSEFDAGLIERQRWTSFDGSLRALARIAQGHEYITYESPDGACRILTGAAGTFGSQHMRRILAEGLGCAAKWNWRDHPQPRLADETCLRVTGFLRSGAPA